MENHFFSWENSLFPRAVFNSFLYVYQRVRWVWWNDLGMVYGIEWIAHDEYMWFTVQMGETKFQEISQGEMGILACNLISPLPFSQRDGTKRIPSLQIFQMNHHLITQWENSTLTSKVSKIDHLRRGVVVSLFNESCHSYKPPSWNVALSPVIMTPYSLYIYLP